MTLREAIFRLQDSLDHNTILITQADKEALRLGIEALKRIQSQYDPDHQMMRISLPGETI